MTRGAGKIAVYWVTGCLLIPSLLQAQEPRWAAPPLERSISVRPQAAIEPGSWSAMVEDLAKANVVFIGETHNDETTHRVELALLEELLRLRAGKVVLAMEMFDRDVQHALDDYLAGRIDESAFLARSRPWPNYATAYRPLVEKARQAGIAVVASNFPRPLIRHVAEAGDRWWEQLTPQQRTTVPARLLPHPDAYWRRVDNAVRSHAEFFRGGDRLLSTQSLWDNAMGDTCAQLADRYPDHVVLHINGDFHSAYRQGVVYQLLQRRPNTLVKTLSLVPTTNPETARWVGASPADYVVFVLSLAAEKDEDRFSVVGSRKIKYDIHLPATRSPNEKLPLVIVLVDDGLVAQDGMQWWTMRLKDQAAIVAIEPLYKETQPDFQLGGKWFWNDSFGEDIGSCVRAVEEIWSYVARHFPVDPDKVAIVGEGTGATVAVAAAVWSERHPAATVALRPRQFAKLRDMPLPLPELWGSDVPPDRSVKVLPDAADVSWWQEEAEQYRSVGISAEVVPLDPSANDIRLWENEARRAIGLPAAEEPAASRKTVLLVPSAAPRARHWCRMQAEWLRESDQLDVTVTNQQPEADSVQVIETNLRPENFSQVDALPRCPGPFGGTTVVVLPADTPHEVARQWLNVEQQDPLARQSRFHRLRIATLDGDRSLPDVVKRLESENRKNILLVPAVFYADRPLLEEIRRQLEPFENRLTLHWLPGLGGSKHALCQPAPVHQPIHYDIVATLVPDSHELIAQCRVKLPPDLTGKEPVTFELDRQCSIDSCNVPLLRINPEGDAAVKYQLQERPKDGVLELRYRGRFNYVLSEQKEEYTRGFRQTRGWIGTEGVYLDGKSRWIPFFDERLVTFQLKVEQPPSWHVISQGKGTSKGADGFAVWRSETAMEEVFLVGGPLYREQETAGNIELLVYLRQPDHSLSRQYLETGAQYLEMYRQLIGPYPYSKFAVVENFWETGYGMPSFTLLGPQVIRFPFILHSSYPHEILHNWWGNGVFVDYSRGNWSEGLTAYLADHLVQEQRGLGSEHRRSALQRYRDYVRQSKDFPLSQFHDRHDAATEAVGYAKCMMIFHMARSVIGDESFRQGLAGFFRRYRGTRASIEDLRRALEEASGKSLENFFQAWWNRPGAPRLELRQVKVTKTDSGKFVVEGLLAQTQAEEVFPLHVPIYLQTQGGALEQWLPMDERELSFRIETDDLPVALHVDPHFDSFRQLDYRETPPTLSGLFGQERVVAVMPRKATALEQQGYQQFVEAWRSENHRIEVVWDDEIAEWPVDVAVWVLGRNNRWFDAFIEGAPYWHWHGQDNQIVLGTERVPVAGRTVVAVRRHPHRQDLHAGWISVDVPAAFAGVARKLPHYGKYSYLVFEGEEPTNTIKGQWVVEDSPLRWDLRADGGEPLPPLETARKALAELPPAFSGRALASHVEWLAAPEREGRGVGTKGLTESAHYIAEMMKQFGLRPGGSDGTFFQRFSIPGPSGEPVECLNVIGVLPGKRAEWQQQSVIVSAHYDHLGKGWPDVRAGNEGVLHPGADDNASGVAVMLEVARALAQQGGGARPLIVIAFSAEEANRAGSRYFVEHPTCSLEGVRAVINLDSVGRLENREILVLGTSSADEWQHIFRGCSFVTGVPSRNVAEDVGGSDQVSFLEKGIPAVQLFTGPHADYHRPSDTADKVDVAGMVKVASYLKEAVEYLLDRDQPLTVRIHQESSPPPVGESSRRVIFGVVPAYDYTGPGVKLDGTVNDSPAARAGLRAGDIVVRLNDKPIANLREFSQLLRTLQPGQTVQVTVRRNGQVVQLPVKVEQR